MPKSLLSVVVLVNGVSLISAGYTYFRGVALSSGDLIAARGVAGVRKDKATFYANVALVVGLIGLFVFRGMVSTSPAAAQSRFLLLAIGIGLVFEIMRAVMFKKKGIADVTLLNVLYVAAYGWLLPQLFPA